MITHRCLYSNGSTQPLLICSAATNNKPLNSNRLYLSLCYSHRAGQSVTPEGWSNAPRRLHNEWSFFV